MSQTLKSYHRKRIKKLLYKNGKVSHYLLMQRYMRACLIDFEEGLKSLKDSDGINIVFENETPYYYVGTIETEIIDVEKPLEDWWEDIVQCDTP